ncbi:MAG TPA: hypothetical protein VGU74_00730 [Gemmatimonadales bacterium]|nr:hypothetical protein [Gemmatimonadales bacterium]
MLIVAVLFATVLLRFAIVLVVVYLMLPATRICPHCATDLTLIRHPMLRRLIPRVEHRWCIGCGWNGLVRRVPRPPQVPQSRVISRAARS